MLAFYIDALTNKEDFLLKRLYTRISEAEDNRYTSITENDWANSVRELIKALINYLECHDGTDPFQINGNFTDNLDDNQIAAAGMLAAKHQLQSGVRFDSFLRLLKLIRRILVDLVHDTCRSATEERQALAVIHHFCELFELGFITEWVHCEESASIRELQDSNRDITNRKMIEEELARHSEELEYQVLQRTAHLQREIEERTRVEGQKDRLEKQLLQAQKLEAIGTFAGGIVHDFNNILAGILAFGELARRQVQNGTSPSDSIDEIVTATNRAADLVRQILTFSHNNSSHKVQVEFQTIIREVLSFLRPVLGTTIDVECRIQTEDDRIIVDPIQIHQVLVNLCTNAATAMQGQGGTLLLVLDQIEIESNPIYVQYGIRSGSYIKLNVRDTGCGISPDILDRIFEPFFTTNELGKGTGMGLAVVHTIIQEHGGFITVDSSPGEWTNFTILLPRSQLETSTEKEASFMNVSHGTEKILFVDDEEVITRANKELLERIGYSVVTSNSSKEALEIFRSQPDEFDIVVTDQIMPHFTGDELYREIRDIRPDIPVVLCSGFSEKIDEASVLKSGFSRYLLKPVSINTLGDTIREVLDRG